MGVHSFSSQVTCHTTNGHKEQSWPLSHICSPVDLGDGQVDNNYLAVLWFESSPGELIFSAFKVRVSWTFMLLALMVINVSFCLFFLQTCFVYPQWWSRWGLCAGRWLLTSHEVMPKRWSLELMLVPSCCRESICWLILWLSPWVQRY